MSVWGDDKGEGVDLGPARAGAPWTPDEERQLYDSAVCNVTAANMARAHGRTIGSVASRLRKLGLHDCNGKPVHPWPSFVPKATEQRASSPQQRGWGNCDASVDESAMLANLRRLTPAARGIASALIASLVLLDERKHPPLSDQTFNGVGAMDAASRPR